MDIRILIVAPDPLARSGLAALVESQPGCIVVGQSASLDDLAAAVELHRPDAGLVDLGFDFEMRPGALEVDADLPLAFLLPMPSFTRFFSLAYPAGEMTDLMPAWTKRGSRAYLKRSASPGTIVGAITAILAGLVVIQPVEERAVGEGGRESIIENRERGVENQPIDGLNQSVRVPVIRDDELQISSFDSPVIEPLTPREMEVLALVAEGLPNKRIAQKLGISEHTVKFHVNAIITKLGVESRTEAVTRAARLGILRF